MIFTEPSVANNFAHFIAKAAGVVFNPKCDVCICRVSDVTGKLLGGVIIQDYTGASCGIHVAGFAPHWLNRDLLWTVFDYVFRQLGCKKLFSQIPETNTKSLEFNLKLGFKEVTRIDGVFLDGAVIVTCLDKGDCRWLDIAHSGIRSNR